MRTLNRALTLVLMLSAALTVGAARAAEGAGGEHEGGVIGDSWKHWQVKNEVSNITSVQRGARNFVSYCLGCHSLKYMRWSRLAEDLKIPDEQLEKLLLPPGDKPADYILSTMPQADAEAWFGKAPPDLSLMARARGPDHIYQF